MREMKETQTSLVIVFSNLFLIIFVVVVVKNDIYQIANSARFV